jgi:hypothetical protein
MYFHTIHDDPGCDSENEDHRGRRRYPYDQES